MSPDNCAAECIKVIFFVSDSEDGTSCSEEQHMNDSKLEVMALYSSFHIARLQVGLSEPLKLGQVSQVKVS